MVSGCGSPSVEHAGHADLRPETLGVGRDVHHGLRRCAEQQAVDRPWVPKRDAGDLCGHCEDDVEVLDRQQIFGPRLHPVACGRALAFGAVPVLARVIGDVMVAAFGTPRHMPAEHLGPAGLYSRHQLELAETDMTRIGPAICGTIVPKDVSDLQPWARQTPEPLLQSPPNGVVLQLFQHLIRADGPADEQRRKPRRWQTRFRIAAVTAGNVCFDQRSRACERSAGVDPAEPPHTQGTRNYR